MFKDLKFVNSYGYDFEKVKEYTAADMAVWWFKTTDGGLEKFVTELERLYQKAVDLACFAVCQMSFFDEDDIAEVEAFRINFFAFLVAAKRLLALGYIEPLETMAYVVKSYGASLEMNDAGMRALVEEGF